MHHNNNYIHWDFLIRVYMNKYASTNIAATRVLANTKQKTKSISQYQTNKKQISESGQKQNWKK